MSADNDRKPMAVEASAETLLRSAARLIERALVKLDMETAQCPTCSTTLRHNWDQARVYERLSDTPTKLVNCAEILRDSVRNNGTPRQTQPGYAVALAAKQRSMGLVTK